MSEHRIACEVVIDNKTYYVSCSAVRRLKADLDNAGISYSACRKTKRKYHWGGNGLWFNGTLEKPIAGAFKLRQVISGRK